MKRDYKKILKYNLVPLFFIACSFIFTTFAWFAYSGLAKAETEINVKAWYIELSKDGEVTSNNIVISLDEIYPGMETVHEVVEVKNMGDSDASLNYEIESVRILDEQNFSLNDELTTETIEDTIAHDYPFHVNMNLSKNYIKSGEDKGIFEVSVSWPLDSGKDELDTEWGIKAYNFQSSELSKYNKNKSYEVRPSIKIVISLTAEQYLENNTSSDMAYNLGDSILYNINTNKRCSELSDTCIKTTVIDKSNTLADTTVTLLPSLYSNFGSTTFNNYEDMYNTITSSWNVTTRPLLVDDVLKIISTDILESNLVINVNDSFSNIIIGHVKSAERIEKELIEVKKLNGYYTFKSDKFNYLNSANCYWLNNIYDEEKAFALQNQSNSLTKIYAENKTTACKIMPVIIADKSKLEAE